MRNQSILVARYLQLLKQARPNLVAKKNPAGSLELSHILWMLEKMSTPTYTPLTTNEAWISWIQASLFQHKLIHIQHERDITREIMSRKDYKYAHYINSIEAIVTRVKQDPAKYQNVTMHQVTDCLMTRLTGCFEAGMEHYFNKKVMEDETPEADISNANYLVEALFGMDSTADKTIPGFIMHDGEPEGFDTEEYTLTTEAWLSNSDLILNLLKGLGYVS